MQELIFDEVQVYLHTVAAAEEGDRAVVVADERSD